MPSLKVRHGVGDNAVAAANPLKIVKESLSSGLDSTDNTPRGMFLDIPVEDITPRSVNRYSQTRLERLAKSIHNTNDRLIHPIVVVRASDLPAKHEVILKFKEQGVDISTLKYVIVSGERRYRAWLILREQEAEKIKNDFLATNRFDKITANVLNSTEALNENCFFEDANQQARDLTAVERILHIKDILEEIKTPEQKRKALVEMNDGSEAGINADPIIASKKFNLAKYCSWYLKNEIGVDQNSDPATCKGTLAIINGCGDEIVDAIIANQFPQREAKKITKFSRDEQNSLLELYKKGDMEAYKSELAALLTGNSGNKKIERQTNKDQIKMLKTIKKHLVGDKKELENNKVWLGDADKKTTAEYIKLLDEFCMQTEAFVKKFQ